VGDASAWRPSDEAWLTELEDELLIAALWQLEAPGAQPLHPRAVGLVHAWREAAPDEVARLATALPHAVAADRLRRLARPERLAGLRPALLHHLAVFNARVASARARDSEGTSAAVRSLAAWIALADERHYMASLATLVLGDAAPSDVAWDHLVRKMDELCDRAQAGAMALDDDGHGAMRTLGQVSDACRIAGCHIALQKRVEALAERMRSRVIDRAIAPIHEALADANARGTADVEGEPIMQRLVAIWRWSDWDEHVERYAIDEVTPIAWNIYQIERGFTGLRSVLGPIAPLVDNLARRVEDDEQRIAYAAPVAQMFVFRSEMAASLAEQLAWAERSVRLCPSHRNGRLVLARLLCSEVRAKLEQGLGAMLERDELLAKIERAAELHPELKDIAPLRERVERLHFWKRKSKD
jgi:hypothetical protein